MRSLTWCEERISCRRDRFSIANPSGYGLIPVQSTLSESTLPEVVMPRCPLVCLLSGAIALLYSPATSAQIVLDGSLGNERARIQRDVLVNGQSVDQIEGGIQRGGNLFHSFETFNVNDGQRVYFAAPSGIDRLLVRVTGRGRSRINGTLGVLGTADFFLLNRNGILFGRNARLDVGGSFVASSASAIEFGDRGVFSTNSTQPPSPLLTIQPTALLVNSLPQPIVNRSSAIDPTSPHIVGLQVPAGRSLLLIGGNIRLNGGVLTARGGVVELAAAQGTVPLSQGEHTWQIAPSVRVQGNVVLQNQSAIQVESAARGSVALYGEAIALQNSGITAGIAEGLGGSASQAGDITLSAARAVRLQNSVVSNVLSAGGRGHAGDIHLQAEAISLSDRAQIQTSTRSQGNAGDLNITTGSLSLTGGSGLFATTSDRGNAGNIWIQAQDAVVFDFSTANSTVDPGAIGRGGSIAITAESLSLIRGSSLIAAVFGSGRAGAINLNIDGPIRLDGSDRQGNFSLIASAIG
ncbi:filamentous hemagglutinin N-terminal domain-containing protein, partial [Oculatella sp. LEGE 06141]|uniref:two-partner secretion domain-containing protein n=1 Tax=Oculatella sp. LEGE 06141 TaxID=1828648 RepID=UPI0018821210|nr:filamentous hemagglutinin N-terminal domain-containing protein [Oculatella sp. LEGE 06141]